MIVEAAMPYSAKAVPKGGRTERECWYLDRVMVRIDEVEPADAPAAFRIEEGSRATELLWRDGRVWWPLMESGWRDPARWSEMVGSQSPIGAGLGLVESLGPGVNWPEQSIEDASPKKVSSNGRDQAAARLHAAALDVMVCGGRMYVAGDEPVCRIAVVDRGMRPQRIKEVSIAWTDNYPPDRSQTQSDVLAEAASRGWLFRADRTADASAYAKQWASRIGATFDSCPKIRVLIPEALRTEVLSPFVRQAAEGAETAMAAKWPPEALDRAEELCRDLARTAADPGASAGDIAPPMRALVAFADERRLKTGSWVEEMRAAIRRTESEAGAGVREALPGTNFDATDDAAIAAFTV